MTVTETTDVLTSLSIRPSVSVCPPRSPYLLISLASSQALASDVTYFAGGAMEGMTYGNGLDFVQTLNARFLPQSIKIDITVDITLTVTETIPVFDAATNPA